MELPQNNKIDSKAKFIKDYMNDHGKIRWLRGIFIDEDEKIKAILDCMDSMEERFSQTLQAEKEKWIEKIMEMNTPLDETFSEKEKEIMLETFGTAKTPDYLRERRYGYNKALQDTINLLNSNDTHTFSQCPKCKTSMEKVDEHNWKCRTCEAYKKAKMNTITRLKEIINLMEK